MVLSLSFLFNFICFNIVGKHERSVKLTYWPSSRNAVCCNADYIFVAEYDGDVHVYTWTGLHIKELRLTDRYDTVHAIQCSRDGIVLWLATRESVHTFKVSNISMTFYTTHIVLLYSSVSR